MKKLLVIRFSALGDVAMTVPLVRAIAQQYPDTEVTFLSKKMTKPLFEQMPQNVRYIGADFNGIHKGHFGWQRLMKEIDIKQFDAVADLHGSLRSKRIRLNAWLRGKQTAGIDKGRAERKQLTRKDNKVLQPIRPVVERYGDVFRKLGYDLTIVNPESFFEKEPLSTTAIRIGIAPFAKHAGKIYPLHLMEQVVERLSKLPNVETLLFGAGKEEADVVNRWCSAYPNTQAAMNLGGMGKEMEVMSGLHVMLTMDSANMHLANLVKTPTVSIWGATHPYCGFLGWTNAKSRTIQKEMGCRPCSAYGNKPCLRNDYACLNTISPQEIVDALIEVAHNQ